MAEVKVKIGANTETITGVSKKIIERKMKELRHFHKCGSCDATNCNGKPSIENEFVTRGIEVVANGSFQKRIISSCLCYRKLLDTDKPYTPAETERKYGRLFSVSPTNEVLSSVGYSDYDSDDYSDEIDSFMEEYGQLLDDFEEPIIYRKSKHH